MIMFANQSSKIVVFCVVLAILGLDASKGFGQETLDGSIPQKSAEVGLEESNLASLMPSQSARINRSNHLLLNASPIDTWIPFKYGVTIGKTFSKSFAVDLQYLRATLTPPELLADIGRITEQRLSLLIRSYGDRNSFNFIYGLAYSKFDLSLGPSFLAFVPTGVPSNLINLQTLNAVLGFGNRWQWDGGFSFGVDWATIQIPFYTIKEDSDVIDFSSNSNDQDEAKDVVRALKRIPTFSFFKLQLGYSF